MSELYGYMLVAGLLLIPWFLGICYTAANNLFRPNNKIEWHGVLWWHLELLGRILS